MSQQEQYRVGDLGTPERRKQLEAIGGGRIGTTAEFTQRLIVTINDPLDWYASRDDITRGQYDAGKHFHRLWYYGAEKSRHGIGRYSDDRGGEYSIEAAIAAERRYNAACRAIARGKVFDVTYGVCCEGKMPRDWGRGGFRHMIEGLNDLAKHFRIEN